MQVDFATYMSHLYEHWQGFYPLCAYTLGLIFFFFLRYEVKGFILPQGSGRLLAGLTGSKSSEKMINTKRVQRKEQLEEAGRQGAYHHLSS